MSVVISEVEHRPSADTASEGAAAAPASPARSVSFDEIAAMLRRENSRRARLWAD